MSGSDSTPRGTRKYASGSACSSPLTSTAFTQRQLPTHNISEEFMLHGMSHRGPKSLVVHILGNDLKLII